MNSIEDRKEEEDQQKNWMVCIPRDITAHIASRLPIKSLIKSRFVCKTWKSLSQDPLLVDLHHSRALHNDPCLILHFDNPSESQLSFAEFSGDHKDDEGVVRKFQNPFSKNMPIFNVVGSCHGLLCLVNPFSGDELCIHNPFTRDYKELPKLAMSQKLECIFGFGRHSSSKEFKVIKIVYYPCIPLRFQSQRYRVDKGRSPKSEVQVLTLGSKVWRNIGEVPYQLEKSSDVSTNGRIHWLSDWCYGIKDRIIVSFDLSDELFKEVPKPNFHEGEIWYNCQLLLLKGCLSAAVFVPSTECCNFDIWIMEEYGKKESWIKQFRVGDYLPQIMGPDYRLPMQLRKDFCKGSLVKVLCLLKNGEILLQFKGEALVSYNPESGMCKNLRFQGMPNLFQTIVHVGSLNWIDIP